VPFLDLKVQFTGLRDEVLVALAEVAESACYVLGPRVQEFEAAFAQFTGAKHCVALNSGTSALHLALIAAGVGPGDEVIAPAMTFVATAWAIRYVGATPVFADVDSQTYTLDPEQVERRITPRTRAILPVHLYGQPANLASLSAVAAKRGITLIEDAAQAHAATFQGRHVGSFGLCGCFSFYPGKNLGAYGEGGAVVTNDDEAARRIRSLRDHAQRQRYCHEELGFNYRMDAFQGAVLAIKLKHLAAWTAARRGLADRYRTELAEMGLNVPFVAADREHAWHLFVLLHENRDQIRAALAERNIQTGLHYPIPVHLQPAFRDLGHCEGDFPVSERIGRECLSLPMFPEMTDLQQSAVIEALAEAVG
jgi:dTDP-4-amino-4,6-dideoxygalactose transaminase